MPTRDEILRDLLSRVAELEAAVAALGREREAWDQEFDLGAQPAYTVSPLEEERQRAATHVPAPLAPSGEVKPSRLQREQFEGEDPEEDTPEVIEARRRIEQANAEDLQPVLHVSEVRVDPTVDGATVTVPSPTDSQQQRRTDTGEEIVANLPGIEPELAYHAYIEGGPIWLYAFDRHHCVNLPDPLKVEMVQDVAATAPETAHEMARDFFKVTDPDVQSSWAHDKMEGVRDQIDSGMMLHDLD